MSADNNGPLSRSSAIVLHSELGWLRNFALLARRMHAAANVGVKACPHSRWDHPRDRATESNTRTIRRFQSSFRCLRTIIGRLSIAFNWEETAPDLCQAYKITNITSELVCYFNNIWILLCFWEIVGYIAICSSPIVYCGLYICSKSCESTSLTFRHLRKMFRVHFIYNCSLSTEILQLFQHTDVIYIVLYEFCDCEYYVKAFYTKFYWISASMIVSFYRVNMSFSTGYVNDAGPFEKSYDFVDIRQMIHNWTDLARTYRASRSTGPHAEASYSKHENNTWTPQRPISLGESITR